MSLQIQIYSLIYSFFFGIVFSILVNLHYDMLMSKKKWFQILMNFIFVIDMALLYFLILKNLNGGIIHLYFYLVILLGFLLGYVKTKRLRLVFSKIKNLTKSKKGV